MLIQHSLTEEIFAKVFDDSDLHQHHNVARELYALEGAFFTDAFKRQTLKGLESCYAAIRAAAAQIASHGEKQTFLKVICENFHKVHNTKAADQRGSAQRRARDTTSATPNTTCLASRPAWPLASWSSASKVRKKSAWLACFTRIDPSWRQPRRN